MLKHLPRLAPGEQGSGGAPRPTDSRAPIPRHNLERLRSHLRALRGDVPTEQSYRDGPSAVGGDGGNSSAPEGARSGIRINITEPSSVLVSHPAEDIAPDTVQTEEHKERQPRRSHQWRSIACRVKVRSRVKVENEVHVQL